MVWGIIESNSPDNPKRLLVYYMVYITW